MTPTARYADILLPAAMFLELDDIYMGWGHTALTIGPRVLDNHAECRSSLDVVNALAKRLGADHPSVLMSSETLVDATLLKRQRTFLWQTPPNKDGSIADPISTTHIS